MKKISLLLAVAAVAMGFSSCEEDRGPVYQNPTEFVLNTPAMQDQYIDLTEGNTLELVASQPDYGYSAIAQYSAEMSLTSDFSDPVGISPTNPTLARMTFKQEDVAIGLCELLGIEGEDDFNAKYPDGMPYMQVYFRAVCQLDGVAGSEIKSNVVSYNHIKGYLAIASPGYIYLVGSPSGWSEPNEANAEHYAAWRLFEPEDAIGSKIYTGVFTIPAGAEFRFYTELAGWGDDGCAWGIGAHEVDGDKDDITDEITAEGLEVKAVHGKGSWILSSWGGGEMTIVVNASDENNLTVTFYAGSASVVVTKYVYMVGNNGGWVDPVAGNYEDWKLADTEGTGIYEGTFDFTDFTEADGTLYCRFYQTLSGWGQAQWAANVADGDNTEVTSGVACNTVVGEGCFFMPVNGHKVSVVLDTNLDQVTFTYVDE